MSDHKIVGDLFDLLFHKPVGIPNGALTNAESQRHVPLAFFRMLQMVGIDVHPLGVLERELEIVEENAQFSFFFFLSKN